MKKVLYGVIFILAASSFAGCYDKNITETDELYGQGHDEQPLDSIDKGDYPIPPNGKVFYQTKK